MARNSIAFLADECFNADAADVIRSAGYSVQKVTAYFPLGTRDEHLFDLSIRTRAILLTHDVKHSDFVFRHGVPAAGIVLFRRCNLSSDAIALAYSFIEELKTRPLLLFGYLTTGTPPHNWRTRAFPGFGLH